MFQRRHHGGLGRHSRGPGMGIALLAAQMAQIGFDKIPPVTLVAIVGQVVTYLRLFNMRWPSTSEVCVSAMNVWYKQDYQRLILAAFFHADEWHLYFNMVSMLWKGLRLEPLVGSGYFMYMIVVFTILTNSLYVGMSVAAENILGDHSYLSTCAVGFSGVLFALKVVTTHMSPGNHRILGFIPVPSRYVCWAELLLIHILVPRSSFVGHLAGIVVGMLYIKGPLKSLMETLIQPEPTQQGRRAGSSNYFTRRFRDWATSSSGSPNQQDTAYRGQQDSTVTRGQQQPGWAQHAGGMSEDEQLQHAMRESLRRPAHSYEPPTDNRPLPTAPPDDDITPPPYPGPASQPSAPPMGPPPAYGEAFPQYSDNQRLYPDLSNAAEGMDGTANSPSVRPGELPSSGGSSGYGTASYPSVTADEIRRRRLQRFGNTS